MTELQSSIDAADELRADSHVARSAASSEHRSESLGTPHASTFRAVTGGLIGLAVAAIVVAVVVGVSGRGGSSGSSAPWSSWAPPEGGNLGARDIADHIAPTYRLSAVNQLAVVTVVNLAQQSSTTAASASTAPTTDAAPSRTTAGRSPGAGAARRTQAGSPEEVQSRPAIPRSASDATSLGARQSR